VFSVSWFSAANASLVPNAVFRWVFALSWCAVIFFFLAATLTWRAAAALARPSLSLSSLLPFTGPISIKPVPSMPMLLASATTLGHPSLHAWQLHLPSSVRSRHPTNMLMFSSWYVWFVCSPFLTAFVITKPLASMSSLVCHATDVSEAFPYLIAMPLSSSTATIFPLCHSVFLLLGLTHVISISVPCPSTFLISTGTVTRVTAPSGSASLTDVPASSITSCHCCEPSSYSIINLGSSPFSHCVCPTVPVRLSPLTPSRVSPPPCRAVNAFTLVPRTGNHRPLWFSCLGMLSLFGIDFCIHIISVAMVLISRVPTAALINFIAFFTTSLSLSLS